MTTNDLDELEARVAVLEQIRSTSSVGSSDILDLPDGNWQSVARELAASVGWMGSDNIVNANSYSAQVAFFGPPQASADESRDEVGAGVLSFTDGVTVRAFWWGFHVEFSHEAATRILDSADVLNSVVSSIGGSIPSPAQPWIKLLAPFIAGTHKLLRDLDKGQGLYVSMSWFAPGVFIPTAV
ncbi:hypothetical protein PY310_21150 [Pseudarthrobacter sp. H3Y2-7]|uniref:hypothetical protein n=1 Tax=Pseudarthrobacter naphthalenicus TaxID=3031328 RepID=UPI0023B1DAE4|nr:hypothetical protein [Pseudarthrobacter sp. H3Y2-7]MDE8671062.1 hypothetical protein [Pseudarthrobacter sp. H3Y2-7]